MLGRGGSSYGKAFGMPSSFKSSRMPDVKVIGYPESCTEEVVSPAMEPCVAPRHYFIVLAEANAGVLIAAAALP